MPKKGLRLPNRIPVILQANHVSRHILPLLCFLEAPWLPAATANNNMLWRLLKLSRELRIRNSYCRSLDGVLFAHEGDISAESAISIEVPQVQY